MPNWCDNTVKIYGPKEKLKRLKDWGHDGSLLEAMVPLGDWDYNKSVQEWGTKWDVEMCDAQFEEMADDDWMLNGSFQSAWSPPIEAYATWLAANEDCELYATYYEPGCAFCGIWDNGQDDLYELPGTAQEAKDTIPQELDDNFGIVETIREYEDEEDLSKWMSEGAEAKKEAVA